VKDLIRGGTDEIIYKWGKSLYLLDGTVKTGTTDENGIMQEKGLPVEDVVVRIDDEEQM
jgi:hypothetical protein